MIGEGLPPPLNEREELPLPLMERDELPPLLNEREGPPPLNEREELPPPPPPLNEQRASAARRSRRTTTATKRARRSATTTAASAPLNERDDRRRLHHHRDYRHRDRRGRLVAMPAVTSTASVDVRTGRTKLRRERISLQPPNATDDPSSSRFPKSAATSLSSGISLILRPRRSLAAPSIANTCVTRAACDRYYLPRASRRSRRDDLGRCLSA